MSAESRVEAIRVLSHAAGADGMVAGQVIDTLCGVSTQQELTGMYRLKTGVMISAAAELGCVASGMPAVVWGGFGGKGNGRRYTWARRREKRRKGYRKEGCHD